MYCLKRGDLSAKPEAFGQGAVMVMRAATSLDLAAAERVSGDLVGNVIAGVNALDAFGIPGLDQGDFDDRQYLLGLSSHVSNTVLAESLVKSWSGFCDQNQNPLTLTRANLSWALLSPVIRKRFVELAYRDVWAEADEGNG